MIFLLVIVALVICAANGLVVPWGWITLIICSPLILIAFAIAMGLLLALILAIVESKE